MASNSTDWFFASLGGGEEKGLNEAGIESFKKGERLPREVVQNCLDNRDKAKMEGGIPVVVTFDHLDLPLSDFPGLQRFRRVLDACRSYVLGQYGATPGTAGNENAFFKKAMEVLTGPTIPTLRIGDENTTGLLGGDGDKSDPYWRLIRGQGYSSLQGPGGGTYGIGQRAPFAHSALRTIIYSTLLENGEQAFVAKNILASFEDPDAGGNLTQNTGWWCVPENGGNWRTIRSADQIPERFQRNAVGTDLYVTGYLRTDWEQKVRWSVLEHFFAAIELGHLVVRLARNGEVFEEINKDNLDARFVKACDEAKTVLSSEEYRKGLGASLYYLRALREPLNGKPFEETIDKLGKVQLYVYRDADAPDMWGTMRAPRIIVEGHGSRILRGFAALFVCSNPSGNEYLATMEDPAHVRWHEDEARSWTDEQKAEGREVRLAIQRFVRKTLKELRQADQPEEQDVPDLGRYLPLEETASTTEGMGLATHPTGRHTEEETGLMASQETEGARKGMARAHFNPGPNVTMETGPGDGPGGSGKKRGKKKKRGGKRKNKGAGKEKALAPSRLGFRSYRLSNNEYRVILKAEEDVQGDIRLTAVGEDADYGVAITAARTAEGKELKVSGDLVKGLALSTDALELDVEIDSPVSLCLALRS